MTHSCVCRESFMSMTWLIHMCVMTHQRGTRSRSGQAMAKVLYAHSSGTWLATPFTSRPMDGCLSLPFLMCVPQKESCIPSKEPCILPKRSVKYMTCNPCSLTVYEWVFVHTLEPRVCLAGGTRTVDEIWVYEQNVFCHNLRLSPTRPISHRKSPKVHDSQLPLRLYLWLGVWTEGILSQLACVSNAPYILSKEP